MGNVDPGGKLGGHCVFIYIGSLHLLQHPIQGLPILGRADELAVDGEHIALHYLANLVKEVGLKSPPRGVMDSRSVRAGA